MLSVFVSMVPAMARPHTPPPCWSGFAPPGALTKALVLVRKAVLTVLMVDVRALRDDPVPSGSRFCAGVG